VKNSKPSKGLNGSEIAIVGMAGRFPGAQNVDAFWNNLRDGVESITFFTDEQLQASGVSSEVLDNPNYVKARPALEGVELFDASFFGFTPRDAEVMDPQHRLFMECVWEAIENAGYDAEGYKGAISLYAGASMSQYLVNNLYANPKAMARVGEFQCLLSNIQDSLTTRIAYKLNLKGPCYTIQTFCSTSLVAVHVACQSLLNFECDMAVAGGVSVFVPQNTGYWYQEGLIVSPDGHCRVFDSKAQGTVFGNGLGAVVLKRLEDALSDGDHIEAVIKGSATNNDGSLKVSYTAPCVAGQAEVIVEALASAGVEPETVTYVEAHGTGTALGDPTEVTALNRAFRSVNPKKGFCAIGSVKSNIGHLDVAAGVAGLIKTILSLKHRAIPPSLHFESPNPEINFENSPFYVNSRLSEWKSNGGPRRAGVSSFGFGGTNAHVVVEEAPEIESSTPSRPKQLLLLSAKTKSALDTATTNLCEYLIQNPSAKIADVVYTLQTGRKAFSHRRFTVCNDATDAVQALKSFDPQRVKTHYIESRDPEIVFMFPGQGAQYVNMGLNLLKHEPVFRERVNQCVEILASYLGRDLRKLLYPEESDLEVAAELLRKTCFQQPAIFTIEYALAKLWEKWGVRPAAMIGHSIGEYVAACLSEVLSLEDALMLVANRGRMMQELPGGSMLSIRLPVKEVEHKLDSQLALAAINAPSLCVVSGPTEAVQLFQRQLEREGVVCRFLHTSHAFHSPIMDSIVKPFEERVRTVRLSPPKIPFISTVTGTWISTVQATDPTYWARQLREAVRFADGIERLWEKPERVLLEVGPRGTCATLARQQAKDISKQMVISSLGDTADSEAEWTVMLNALGQLWLAGVGINWRGFYEHEGRRRVALPTYPFERRRFWIEPALINTSVEWRTREAGTEPQEEEASIDLRTSDPQKAKIDSSILMLKKDLEEASGSDLTDIYESQTFLEMGFDSLFLAQWTLMLKKKFGIHLPVYRLFDDLATLFSVAKYIRDESSADYSFLTGLTGKSVKKQTDPASSQFLEEQKVEAPVAVSESEDKSSVIVKKITKQLQGISEALNELGRPDVSMMLQEIVQSIDTGRRVAGQESKELCDKHREPIPIGPVIEKKGIGVTGQAPIGRVSRTRNLPLSSGQQRLWYLDQLVPNSPVYNLPQAYRLMGKLVIGALEWALNEVIRRHEVLRTTYHMGDGGLVLIISPTLRLEVPIIDLSNKPKNDREVSLAQYLESEAWRPFDLSAGPLLRASIVKLADEEHVLFFMPHHSVFDGWSWAIFQRELFGLYDAFIAGKPSPFQNLPIQYADFACLQREWLKGEEVEVHLAYWRNKLSGKLPVLEIPADFPRPALQPIRGSRETLHIPKALIDSLTALGRSEGATFFMVMLAAFKTLLGRYSGQEDIIVGSPIAGRMRPETTDLIGFFVNTLAFRTNLAGNPSFRKLLRRVRKVCLDAYKHQELPFDRLVEEIQLERDLSRTPVYQAMLIFTIGMMERHGEVGDILWHHDRIASKVAQTDMILWVMEADDGLDLEMEYCTDLFKANTIKRMLKNFEVILEGILSDPDKGIEELPLLTKEELRQLSEWNATWIDYPRDACVHQLFEDQVKKTPERVAVVHAGSELTYLELNKRANRLAHYLRKIGIGPDMPVGIYMERCAEMLVGLFGILKAGGAYVPLDPEYPKERLAYMMEDAQIKVLLTQERFRDEIPKNSARVFLLDADWEKIAQHSELNPVNLTRPENLTYVIYTSGSTGKPKGVQVPHGAVVNFLLSMVERPGFTQHDVLLAVTTLSFDIHVLELYLPLIVGARTVVVSREVSGDGMMLLEALQNSRATVMQATPGTWRLLLAAGWKGSHNLKVLCGGEAFPPDLARELLERAGSVWNMYGPTETTVWSTCYLCNDANAPILIGRPIANTTVYILDKHLQPLPVGVPGELHIGGEGVTRGYWNRPDLTAERFIADPFSKDQKARLYKTRDLARYHPDGNLEYLNRLDNQVKVRGFRIELAEIETVLGEVEAVKQAVVIVREIRPGDARLIAYIVPVPGKTVTPTELRAHLRSKLPEYMIPQHFVELDGLPLTPAGKIDQKELVSAFRIGGGAEVEYVAPRNAAEKFLASIWQEVLKVDRVSTHDNFFEIGGHSLLCMQVIERIRKETGVRLSPRVILLNTLSQIAETLPISLSQKASEGEEVQETKLTDSSAMSFLWKVKKKLLSSSN